MGDSLTDSATGKRTVTSEMHKDKAVVKYLGLGSVSSAKRLGRSGCGSGTLLRLGLCNMDVAMWKF